MRTILRSAFVMGGALTWLVGIAGAEDLTVVSKVSLGKGSPTTSTQFVSEGKLRTSDGEHDTIMDYSTGKMVTIDHKKKEYYETSLAELSATFQEMERQMQGNPIMEKIMGKVGEVTVAKGGAPHTVAGYSCDPYVLSLGESLKFDICAAPSLPVPQQYFDARKASYAGMGPMGKRFEKMFEEMKKIKGFPLSVGTSVKMMMLKQETISEATEVKKGPVPASAFEVPAGYKKKGSPFKKKGS